LRWGLYYTPLIISLIGVVLIYILIAIYVKHTVKQGGDNDNTKKARDKLLQRLRAFPLVFIGCYFFSICNRVYDAALESDDSYILYLLESLTQPLTGFVNAIVYGFDEETRKLLRNSCLRAMYNCSVCASCLREELVKGEASQEDGEVVFGGESELPKGGSFREEKQQRNGMQEDDEIDLETDEVTRLSNRDTNE